MNNPYYYLVAGLPDVTLDDHKLSFSVANFKEEMYEGISSSDRERIDLFFLQFDNANVLRLLEDKEATVDTRGNYTASELLEVIDTLKAGFEEKPKGFPEYLAEFISTHPEASTSQATLPEDRLSALYYRHATACDNKFISSWFEFNLTINNILAAYTARKYKWDVSSGVVGDTEICEALRTSGARDFGIAGEVDFFETLVKISETGELIEREKRLDALRWSWIEDAVFFDYFTIERIFAFLVKLEMIERWISLDQEKGSQKFREIIETLKNEVRIPAEFR